MNSNLLRLSGIVAIVAVVQWIFSVNFNTDEWQRIICTAIGVAGIEVLGGKKPG